MTNTNRLNQLIDASGFRRNYIAEQLGISSYALSMKIRGETEFKGSEIGKLRHMLNIQDLNQLADIFFN